MVDKLKKLVKGYRKSIEIMDARSKAGGERADEAFCRMLELERVVADLEELMMGELEKSCLLRRRDRRGDMTARTCNYCSNPDCSYKDVPAEGKRSWLRKQVIAGMPCWQPFPENIGVVHDEEGRPIGSDMVFKRVVADLEELMRREKEKA